MKQNSSMELLGVFIKNVVKIGPQTPAEPKSDFRYRASREPLVEDECGEMKFAFSSKLFFPFRTHFFF